MCLMRDHTALRSDLRTYGLALTAWLTSLYGTLASESGIRRGEKNLRINPLHSHPSSLGCLCICCGQQICPPPPDTA